MEAISSKKKNVWATITRDMNKAGYNYTQNQIENKWKTLLRSHKAIVDNRKQTGGKRKTFQYFEEIQNIVGKRHDITPPLIVSSTQYSNVACAKSSDKIPYKRRNKVTSSLSCKQIKASECGKAAEKYQTEEENISEGKEETMLDTSRGSSLELSTSDSARKRRERRKQVSEESNVALKTLQFLREMEAQRKAEHEAAETEKAKRAKERNEILRELIGALKK